MRDNVCDASDSIYILSFVETVKTVSDSNRILEGAALCVIHYILKKPCDAAFSSRLKLKSSRSSKFKEKDNLLFSCTKVVNHLPLIYAANDVTAETVYDIHSFIQDTGILATFYSDDLWTKVLGCG